MGAFNSSNPDYLGGPLPPLPEFINRYKLLRLLGTGGQGAVYLAWDELLAAHVAIKVPLQLPDESEKHFLQRARKLVDEAQKARRLADASGIVSVYDIGRTKGNPSFPDGTPYVVMQFIEGCSLFHHMREMRSKNQRLSPPQIAVLTARVAWSLHHAHRKGLIHRDVKPRNILIDREGKPWITDFGLAVDFHQYRVSSSAGTLGYLSPEQVARRALDARTDIFSLGVVFYELLTGKSPFEGPPRSDTFENSPTPPRQLDPNIPRELERICLKCLAIDAGDRYTTSTDLARDLCKWRPPGRDPIRHYCQAQLWEACTAQFCPDNRHGLHPANHYVPTPADWDGQAPIDDIVAQLATRLAKGEKRLAICGKDGQGKTFLAWRLALHVVRKLEGRRIPIVFPLREFNPNSEFKPVDQIENFVQRKFPHLDLKHCMNNENCILILDGVDEIPCGVDAPAKAFGRLLKELSRFPRLAVMTTFETGTFERDGQDYRKQLPGFDVATLGAWNIKLFEELLCRCEKTGFEGFSGGWRAFSEKVLSRPPLRRLVRNPLACQLIVELGDRVFQEEVQSAADLCNLYQLTFSLPAGRASRLAYESVDKGRLIASLEAGTYSSGMTSPLSLSIKLACAAVGVISPHSFVDLMLATPRVAQALRFGGRKMASLCRRLAERIRRTDRAKERFGVPDADDSSGGDSPERMTPRRGGIS